MAPILEPFSAQDLPSRVQYLPDGKKRKQPIDLTKCQLLEMEQFKCKPVDEVGKRPVVKCWPIVRVFRRCANGVTVETTKWDEEVI